jgi:hypothetical protein
MVERVIKVNGMEEDNMMNSINLYALHYVQIALFVISFIDGVIIIIIN